MRTLLPNGAYAPFENELAYTLAILDGHRWAINGDYLEDAWGAHDDNFIADLQHGPSLRCDRSGSSRGEQNVCKLSARNACGSVRRMQQELSTGTSTHDDVRFMRVALAAARLGAAAGEVPVGAVLTRDAVILSVAHNHPIGLHDPTAHAEIQVLRDAAQAEENYRLPGTVLYVTAEPCLMCAGALVHARVRRVVFGCREPKTGALALASQGAWSFPGNHRFTISGGVCADEARTLLQEFFQARRGA